jgi:hypothetical protein
LNQIFETPPRITDLLVLCADEKADMDKANHVRTMIAFTLSITLFFGVAVVSEAAPVGTCLAIKNVERWDFLYIRKNPDHRSPKVGAIAPNTSAPVVVTGRCTPNTTNLRRLWCPVEYFVTKSERRTGFVKMYFTKQIKCPPSVEFYRQN